MTGTIAGFTSTGIDDNATSTAITIDASENITLDGWVATNGEWYKLNDAGATIGGIYRSGAVLGTSATDLSVFTEAGKVIHFSVNGVAAPVATVTSNGLTFNGDTAAANALDDYEEGTWTPVPVSGTLTISDLRSATYTKIGNTVNIQCYIATLTSGDSTAAAFSGLPFTSGTNKYCVGGIDWNETAVTSPHIRIESNGTQLGFYKNASTTMVQTEINGGHLIFSATYFI
jgi:hypothetical protein